MIFTMIKRMLGATHKEAQIEQIKLDVQNRAVVVMRKYEKINDVLTQSGVTIDIARVTGVLK